MEETLATATASEQLLRVDHEDITNSLALATADNRELRAKLETVESRLDGATSEASNLVEGLRDNDERWEAAEKIRAELEYVVVDTVAANEALQEEVGSLGRNLCTRRLRILELEATDSDRALLAKRLADAADRERSHLASLKRLEHQFQRTQDQLTVALQRADQAERTLKDSTSPASGVRVFQAATGPSSAGAFEQPAQHNPAAVRYSDPIRAPRQPRSVGSARPALPAEPIRGESDVDAVIDIDRVEGRALFPNSPLTASMHGEAAEPSTGPSSDDSPAGEPHARRAFDRGRSLSARIHRSYGQLPDE